MLYYLYYKHKFIILMLYYLYYKHKFICFYVKKNIFVKFLYSILVFK